MERQRIDLSGGAKPIAAPKGRSPEASGDRTKNLVLLSIAGIAFLIAGYFVYATFFSAPPPPADADADTIESTFEAAAAAPPPPEPELISEPGSGKRLSP